MDGMQTLAREIADRPRRGRFRWSAGAFLGLFGAFALLATAIFFGGSPRMFLNAPALLIVLGGTLCIVCVSSPAADLRHTLRAVRDALTTRSRDPAAAALHAVQTAEAARREGILRLQRRLPSLADEPFFHRAVSMAVDGTAAEEIEDLLRRDLEAGIGRHERSAGVLRRAAEYAPAMGLIGTLVGLVQMLGNLQDPAAIGPSMAIALLTTFYGAVLATMVLLPLAAKVERVADDEILLNVIYLMTALSISRKENPRRLEMQINAVLPPPGRVRYFD